MVKIVVGVPQQGFRLFSFYSYSPCDFLQGVPLVVLRTKAVRMRSGILLTVSAIAVTNSARPLRPVAVPTMLTVPFVVSVLASILLMLLFISAHILSDCIEQLGDQFVCKDWVMVEWSFVNVLTHQASGFGSGKNQEYRTKWVFQHSDNELEPDRRRR